ncbi:hypothetical protein N431DRAFT_454422 [Stipitochalara longipes BDJ]|nr:hypothetical protein N431DRAFT_454422 [Stipitochalara longipes BDJ]
MSKVIEFTPQKFGNIMFRAQFGNRAESEAIIIFYCVDESGQNAIELPIHQKLFFADSVSRVPHILDDAEQEHYNFRAILGVGARVDVSRELESFECFRNWLYTGIYENAQIIGTHLDAYHLSEILQSPRFGNAIMQKILNELRARKFDEDLKNAYRSIFSTGRQSSPLRRLYFQAALFWGLEFSGGGVERPKCFYRSGILGLNPEVDRGLITELQRFRDTFCPCGLSAQQELQSELDTKPVPATHQRTRARSLDDHAGNGACVC